MTSDPAIYDVATIQERDDAAREAWRMDVESFAREVAWRLSASRQTDMLNSNWRDLEAKGRSLFSEDTRKT